MISSCIMKLKLIINANVNHDQSLNKRSSSCCSCNKFGASSTFSPAAFKAAFFSSFSFLIFFFFSWIFFNLKYIDNLEYQKYNQFFICKKIWKKFGLKLMIYNLNTEADLTCRRMPSIYFLLKFIGLVLGSI